jgi:electron transfer flavoprotein alpha/beta subunit
MAICSLEMSKEQLVKRLILAEARIESGLVTRGQLRDSDHDLVYSVNEWDNYAVEEAIQIVEREGGSVTVVSAGDPESVSETSTVYQ